MNSKLPDIPEPVNFKIRDIEKLKVVELKGALKKRGCSAKGNNPALTALLEDAIEKNLEVVCDIGEGEVENFAGEGFSVGAKWELEAANDGDVCIEEGIREIGGKVFREPTVRPAEYVEDESGATKNNYTLNFDRPPFISSCKQLKLNRYQKPMKDQKGDYIYEDCTHTESLPNLEFLESRGINTTSHPADWYNVIMPRSTCRQDKNGVMSIADFTSFANKKEYMYNTGSGGTQYPDFKEFSVNEIMQHIGVYILNGLSPSPQVEMKFDLQKKNRTNGSDFC